jgi:DNA repair protein RecO (recombination protein O)
MLAHSTDALVLRSYRYGEADRIVVFLTVDRGKKRGVARHATASRRRFGAALEALTRGHATYVEREQRELVWLERIEPRRSPFRAAAGRDQGEAVRALGHAAYFAELIDEWAPDNAPNERLFRLGAAVGEALEGGGSIDALARYFEYWLMRLEGVYPEGADLRISDEARAFLREAAVKTPARIAADGGPAAALRELELTHHELIAMHLEKHLRSARVVRELGSAP